MWILKNIINKYLTSVLSKTPTSSPFKTKRKKQKLVLHFLKMKSTLMHIPRVKCSFVKTTLCSLKLISSTCSSFFIDHKFALFGGRDIQQTVGIPMDINSAPPLTDLLL
jgi:hypothetical protein